MYNYPFNSINKQKLTTIHYQFKTLIPTNNPSQKKHYIHKIYLIYFKHIIYKYLHLIKLNTYSIKLTIQNVYTLFYFFKNIKYYQNLNKIPYTYILITPKIKKKKLQTLTNLIYNVNTPLPNKIYNKILSNKPRLILLHIFYYININLLL